MAAEWKDRHPKGGAAAGVPGSWPSWRTTASRPDEALVGRDAVEEGDAAAQRRRDHYWQSRMHEERKAHGITREQEELGRGGKGDTREDSVRDPAWHAGGPAVGVATELRRICPTGLRQVSIGVEERCIALGWRLEHLGATIGTVIHGPRLASSLTAEEVATMYAVLLERKVICFRGQQGLTEEQHMAFARRFGELEVFPFAVREGSDQGILPLRSAGEIATGASGWHSDVTWRKTPSLGSLLYCEKAPPFGGATGFVDCYAAWEGLPEEHRTFLRGKACVHDFDSFRQGQRQQGVSEETLEELRTAYPVASHPICRTHP
jgi:hypothetical protein